MERRGELVIWGRAAALRRDVKRSRWSSTATCPDSIAAAEAGSGDGVKMGLEWSSDCASESAGTRSVQARLRFLISGFAMSVGLADRLFDAMAVSWP